MTIPMMEKAIVWLGKFTESDLADISKNSELLRRYKGKRGPGKLNKRDQTSGFSSHKERLELLLAGHLGVHTEWYLPTKATQNPSFGSVLIKLKARYKVWVRQADNARILRATYRNILDEVEEEATSLFVAPIDFPVGNAICFGRHSAVRGKTVQKPRFFCERM